MRRNVSLSLNDQNCYAATLCCYGPQICGTKSRELADLSHLQTMTGFFLIFAYYSRVNTVSLRAAHSHFREGNDLIT